MTLDTPKFMVTTVEALQLDLKDNRLELTWSDGRRSTYHHIWLRHNCTAARDAGTDQNMNLIEDLHASCTLATAVIVEDALHVTWRDDDRLSVFGLDWLRLHCYSEAGRQERKHQPTLVDASLAKTLPIGSYQDYLTTDAALLETMEQLDTYGYARLSGAQGDDDEIVRMAERFGAIRVTNYGAINDMKVHEDKIVISYTDVALTSHADEPYCDEPLGVVGQMARDIRGIQCADGFRPARA